MTADQRAELQQIQSQELLRRQQRAQLTLALEKLAKLEQAVFDDARARVTYTLPLGTES